MLLSLSTLTYADEANYTMSSDGEGKVFILNVENGDVKMCRWGAVHEDENQFEDNDLGVACSLWRRNSEDAGDYYVYRTPIGR